GISGGLTDINGDYTFAVTPGPFKLHPLSEFVSQLGYVSPDDVPINPAGTSLAIDFSTPKATALIYGTATDSSNNNAPIPNLRFTADNQSATQLEGDGRTSATGDYYLGVIAGDWQVRPEDIAVLGLRSEEHQVTITAGQAIHSNFALGRITAHLLGKVADPNG